MIEVPLTNGGYMVIDAEDAERVVARGPWRPLRSGSGRSVYAYSTRRPYVLVHRFILDTPKRMKVDHINGDGLDNRRSNLRLATGAQNAANQRPQQGRTSRFKGVCWHRRIGKWQAVIKVNQRRHYLGYFVTEEDAARAYNAAAVDAWGEFARLNVIKEKPVLEVTNTEIGEPTRETPWVVPAPNETPAVPEKTPAPVTPEKEPVPA